MSTEKPPLPISPLFARYLTAAEKASLRAVPVDDLASEINLLRVLSAHFVKFQQTTPQDLYSRQQTLLTSLVLSSQMVRLVRARNQDEDPPEVVSHVMFREDYEKYLKEKGQDG